MGYVQLVEDAGPSSLGPASGHASSHESGHASGHAASLGVSPSLSRSDAFFLDSPGEPRARLAHKVRVRVT